MEGSIRSRVCRSVVGSCWARRRSCYQRLPAPPTPRRPALGGGIRLGRRSVLGSAARRFGRLRRAKARWSPLRLLTRVVDTYVSSLLSQPLKIARGVSPPPPKLRRGASSRRGEVGGKGVMLKICVAEVLLRRSSSEVRRSPLQPPREAARCTSVRA